MNEFPHLSEGILGEDDIPKTNTELFLSMVAQYFPEAIKDGEVDFTALKEEMGEFHEVGSEHYDFTWAGKQAAKKKAQEDIFGKSLRYKPQDSQNPDTTENIYIEGDNLEALQLLRRTYHGKIKMIYIDPPYNTGSDFVYRDTFTMTEEEIAKLSGNLVDGVRYQKNKRDNSRYHTKWLNMIYPRLKLSRELLSDDGVVFISIDENEHENLKKICNDVFGSINYIGELVIKTATDNNPSQINIEHEFMLCFAKNKAIQPKWVRVSENAQRIKDQYHILKLSESDTNVIQSKLRNWIKQNKNELDQVSHYNCVDSKGVYSASGNSSNPHPGGYMFDILHPVTGLPCPKPQNGWRWTESTFLEYAKSGEVEWGKDETTQPHIKKRIETATDILRSLIYEDNRGTTKLVTDLFDGIKVFDNPKPLSVISRIIDYITSTDDVILDFFSGSATTAHAVMQLNANDSGNRKFILVQLPENLDESIKSADTNAKKTMQAAIEFLEQNRKQHTICEIGKERIRRAAKKIHEDNPEAVFDDGFKVFEVGGTTIRWNTTNDDEIKLLTDEDYSTGDKDSLDFTKGYTDIDIVYEIMLRQYGIPLSTPIEKLTEISDRTYIFADAVVVCLEPEIDDTLIEKLADIEPTPMKFVLRDSAFDDNIELKELSFRKLSALIRSHQTEEERKSKYQNYTVEFI